jgi:outer membrane receptor protein involved in Fe transport
MPLTQQGGQERRVHATLRRENTVMHHPCFRLSASLLGLTAGLLPALASAQTAPTQPQPTAPAPAQAPADRSNDVTVTGTRSEVVASPDRLSFNVTNDLQVQTGTVADALRAVPGVEVDLEGRVSLRGDSGVTILINGRPSAMMRGESRANVLLSMPAGQIERVEVITNPSAAFSPEGSGGVINLVTRQARQESKSATVRATLGTEGRGALNLNGVYSKSGVTMTGDLGYRRFTGEAGAAQIRERLDPATGNFIASRLDADLDNTMTARIGRFALDYDVDKTNRLSTEFNYRNAQVDSARTDLFTSQVPGAGYDRESDSDTSNRGFGIRTSWRRTLPGSGHELVADLEFQRSTLRRDLEAFTSFAGAPSSYELIRNAADRDDYSIKLDYKRPTGEGRSLNVGYEGTASTNDFAYSGARGTSSGALLPVAGLTNAFDYDQTVHALYGTYQFDLGKLEAQTGLRLEQVETDLEQITDGIAVERDYFRVYPTLHLGYEVAANQKLRGSYSRRIQRPSPQDLNPYTLYIDPLNLRRGNPNLRPEVTDSFELAWQLRKGGTFYALTGFYRTSRGGVTDVVEDLGGVFLTTRANLATTKRAGIEAIANGKFSKTLSYNASATLLWNEIDPRRSGVATPRSGTTGTVRANITWQPSANDYFQLNGFYAGDQLIAQGYRRSSGVLNLGYRRKLSERFSLLLTAQNVLDSARQETVIETPAIRDRFEQRGPGRIFLLGLTYNIGSQGPRRRPDPAFDFDQGGGAGVQ